MRRPWSRALVAVVAAVALAACATGTLRELDRIKQLSAAGDSAAVAAIAVDCTTGPGCAQAHAIRADACLDLAGAAAVDARAGPAACARTGYDRALAALADHADPRVDAARLEAQRLEAIRRERDAVGLERGLALNETLAARAAAFEAAGGAPATAAFYTANAAAFAVAFGEPAAPCARLAEAAAAAERAATASAEAVEQLRRDIANLARLEGCAG